MIAFTLDTETYPNCFLLVAKITDSEIIFSFEISDYRDDGEELFDFLMILKNMNCRAYGFNIVGFDGPIIHMIMKMNGRVKTSTIYEKAMAIIGAQEGNRFLHQVFPSDRAFEWVDLFKINHYDNFARATSLKALEFAMRMDNIQDLPFHVGSRLDEVQIKILKTYCEHDVRATELFRTKCLSAIKFREGISIKYGKDFMNKSDVSIGTEIFQMMLESNGVQCYEYGQDGRTPRQTKRQFVALSECIPHYIKFNNPEFIRIYEWLQWQKITETKGVFEDLKAILDGVEYKFGMGGLHGAITNDHYCQNDEWMIVDWDCVSMYPSISISNNYYPEHLGEKFVEIYKWLKTERVKHKKGTVENAAYKLSLNGTFGKANDKFSVFYDPKFLLSVTMTGQLCLAMLIDRLMTISDLHIKSGNTDGICVYLKRDKYSEAKSICNQWEKDVGLELEEVRYSKVFQADVNNYIAVYEDGKVKRKGRYEYDLEWHQNASSLVIPKVAEKVLLEGVPIRETLENWSDKMDFMLRVKVPRTSQLLLVENGVDKVIQNITRYYVSVGGGALVKRMPPLAKKPDVWRRIGVESGWTVCECNDIRDAVLPINYDYYINEVEKLCLGVM